MLDVCFLLLRLLIIIDSCTCTYRYAGVPVDFEEMELNHKTTDEEYDHAMLSVKRNGVALKGNIYNMIDEPGFYSRNIEIRYCKNFKL